MSQSLQHELQQKEELYNLLKNDYNRLDAKYQEVAADQQTFEVQKDKKVKALEEEVAYLKKHFEIELGVMQDENEILKRELQEFNYRRLKQCQIRHKTPNHKYNMHSPHDVDYEEQQ